MGDVDNWIAMLDPESFRYWDWAMEKIKSGDEDISIEKYLEEREV